MASACTSRVGHTDVCCEAESYVYCCVLFAHCCRDLENVGDEGLAAIAASNQGIHHLELWYDVISLCFLRGSH